VRAGHAVRLTVEGDATVYHGRVVRLSPIVQEQNRTLLIEAEVPNQNAVLKPGAFARAEIVTDGSQPVIRVPAAALVTFAGVEKLLVVRQGKIVEVRVQTGRRANDSIEIWPDSSRARASCCNRATSRPARPSAPSGSPSCRSSPTSASSVPSSPP